MGATIVAFLKALPELVKAFNRIADGIDKLKDTIADNKYEQYKAEMSVLTERLKHVKNREEARDLIRHINSLQ